MNVYVILRKVDYYQPHKQYNYFNNNTKYGKLLVQTYNRTNITEY